MIFDTKLLVPYETNNPDDEHPDLFTTCLGNYNSIYYNNSSYIAYYYCPPIIFRMNPNDHTPLSESGCNGWFSPDSATPDYYHRISGETYPRNGYEVDIPNNRNNYYGSWSDIQQPNDDNGNGIIDSLNSEDAYVGILSARVWGNPNLGDTCNQQEYICQRLNVNLGKGACYEVTLKLSLSPVGGSNDDGICEFVFQQAEFYLNDFGAYFTSDFVTPPTPKGPFDLSRDNYDYINSPNKSTLSDPEGNFKDMGGIDGTHWMEIKEIYRPHEDKYFIYVANFILDWQSEDVLKHLYEPNYFNNKNEVYARVYYYVDSVSVNRISCDTCTCTCYDFDSEDVQGFILHSIPVERQSAQEDCCYELEIEPKTMSNLCWANQVKVYEITDPSFVWSYSNEPDYDDKELLLDYNQTEEFRPDFEDREARKTEIGQICFDPSRETENVKLWVEFYLNNTKKCQYEYNFDIECIIE